MVQACCSQLPKVRFMYTKKQRILSLLYLSIALIGEANLFIFKENIFGLAPKSVAILSFIPLVALVFLVGRVRN